MIRLLRVALVAVACLVATGRAATADDPMAKAGELYERGDFKGAAEIYRKVARKGREAAIAWFNYGNCMARLGRRGEAAQAWKKAIEWAPGFKRARLNLAILAEEDRDWAVASVQYRRLWELDPKDASVALRMGEFQLDQRDPVGAIQWFERALALDSADAAGWQGLVRATLATTDTVQAVELLSRWEARMDDTASGSWFALAALQERAGNLEASRRSTERALAVDPARVEGWLRLARLAQLGGNDATAVAVLRQATARLPGETGLWKALGQAGLRGGDAGTAYEGLREALAHGDSGSSGLVRILADWHDRRGEHAMASRARALLSPAGAAVD